MIVCNRYKFVFVHVPKCAGTSIRIFLQQFVDMDVFPRGHLAPHPRLGMLDYNHIPLKILESDFPEDARKLGEYWSFAIIRDPYERFASSLRQHLLMYGRCQLQEMRAGEVEGEIARAIDRLKAIPRETPLFPVELIHFQRQVDFTHDEGRQLIKSIYRLDELPQLMADLRMRVGEGPLTAQAAPGLPVANRTRFYRNRALQLAGDVLRPAQPIYRKLLPAGFRARIRRTIYATGIERYGELFDQPNVRQFIADYYREDILLWQEARRRTAGPQAFS